MARETTVTKLPLSTWARLVGINPIHFWGVDLDGEGSTPNLQSLCGQAWFQYDWQDHDRVSRDAVALAIAQAEADIEAQVGYRLLPSWEEDEWHETARPWKPELVNANGLDVRGYSQAVVTRWKHVVSGGIRSAELLDTLTIAWSDADGDNYPETGTVTLATSVVDPAELQVFYPGKLGDERWRIRPVNAVISGGNATITFRREMCVIEDLLEQLPNAGEMDLPKGESDANFLEEVDVYRVYNDPQRQVTMLWEPGMSICNCGDSGCPTCAYSTQTGCLTARGDPRLGLVGYRPATWNADTLDFDPASWVIGRNPDAVRLWYYAGYRDRTLAQPTNEMDGFWAYTVAIYAASLLARDLCDCSKAVEAWREDLSHISGGGQADRYRIANDDLSACPFGTRRGAVMAWRRIQQRPGAKVAMGGVYA